MALTKAQVSLVTVATLGVAPGGYATQLMALNTQDEAAAFIASAGLLSAGTNAEYAMQVAKNLGVTVSAAKDFLKALDAGTSRAEATVDFANEQLVANNGTLANVTKAIASTSTSTDLTALKAEVTPVVDAQEVTFNTASGTGFSGDDLKANLGKAEIESGAGKISADFTFNLKNQANVFTDGSSGGIPASEVGEFTGAFLSPMLERAAATQSDSAIYVKLLDGFATRDNYQSIERLATNGIGFSVDGVTVVVADKAEDGANGAIYTAKNYTELKDALTARLAELASGQGLPAGADAATYAKLATFTVELGSIFTKANQAGDQVTGTELVIKDSSGSVLVPQGFSTYGGVHPFTDLNSINELTNQAPTTSTQLISTNINAENVGYGSQGATLNIAGQSASDKGVEEFKLTATKDVWFTRLESRDLDDNQHLQDVLLQTGSNGYFRVGTQKNSTDLVVDLVDQNFGVKGGGLVDVLKLDASAASSTAVNAFISDDVIARNYNLKDTDNNYNTEDVQVSYNLTGGNDVLQLAVASEVLAYADTQVNVVAGSGNDLVHLKVVGNDVDGTTGKVTNAGAGTYGEGWLANQQLNDNVKVDAASGNNTIWTEGSGNVRITTGGGNDTVYADNSGRTTLADAGAIDKLDALGMGKDVNALYVLNARSADIGDILSNTANATDGVTNVAQEFKTFKSTVSVTFKGFESTYVEIASTNYVTNTQQINQAIKKAILEDATLSKLLTVKEFPGNVLVVESLIDGTQALADLSFDFVSPTATAPTAPATLADGQLLITAADLTAAAKAYAPAGTVTPTAVADTALNLETAIQTTYNLDGTGQPQQFAKDGAATGTAEVQTIDFTAVAAALAAGEAGSIQIGSVNIALETGNDAAAIATKVATALNGKMQNADLGVALAGTAADAAVTATANAGIVTITYASTAGDLALVGSPATAALVAGSQAAIQTTLGVLNTTSEVQTIDQAAIAAIATAVTSGSVLVTIGGQEVVVNATDTADAIGAKLQTALDTKTVAALGLTGEGAGTETVAAVYSNGGDLVLTFDDAAGDITGVVSTIAPAVTGAQSGNITGITATQTTQGVAGAAAADVTGADSTAHSDNIINAGAGNDVIALGTGANSNDTVVLTGTFGKTTIVYFDDTTVAAEAVNGGDLLDFRSYLEANYGANGQANVTLVTGAGTLAANTVTVIDFSTLQDSFTATGSTTVTGIKSTDALSSATASQLTAELNADFSAGTTAATKHVFLIHNDNTTATLDNAGEYLVVTANSTAADAKLAGVTIVGTLDFGEAQTFTGNLVGFDGVIA